MPVKLTASEAKKLSKVPHVTRLVYPKQTETELVKQILDYLASQGILAWRNNKGAMFGKHKGKGWAVKFGGLPGASDIFAVKGGRFIAIEAKIGRNKLSDDQADFLLRVRKAGGIGIAAWSLDDVIKGL